jgi:hypothetical protein
MHNEFSSANDEAARFTSKEDEQTRMRDNAAVELAHQIHEWSKDNLARYDNDGNKRVSFGELDLGARTSNSNDDAAALHYLQDHYKEIQDHSQNKFLFFKGAGGVSVDGIGEYTEQLEKQREEDEKRISAGIHERALQAGSREVVDKLMSTPDGNPNNSLFRVIDGLDGGIDNEISKKDLNRYLDEYQRRARYGDIGSGFFTPETRRYVEHLRDNWDSPEMVRVRGTWTRHENDGRDEQVPNSKISEENLKKAIGVSKDGDIFAPFVKEAPAAPVPAKAPVEVKELPPPAPAQKDASQDKVAAAPVEVPKPVQAPAPKPADHHPHPAKAGAHPHPTKHDANCDKDAKGTHPEAAAHKTHLAQAHHDAAPKAPAKAPAKAEAAPVEKAASAPVEVKAAPIEAKPPVVAAPEAKPAEKTEPIPAVVEAPESAKATFSPWKADHQAVSSYVQDRIASNYYNGERDIAKLNAAAAIRDNEAVAKAVNLNEWGKDNLRRFDTSGDNRLNYGELDLGIRTSKDTDRANLSEIQVNFDRFIQQTGDGVFKRHPDAISQKDLEVNVQKRQEEADVNEQGRQLAAQERAEKFRDSQLISGLLASPDGNPNNTLFRVIDGLDNDIDGEISRRDLRRYMDEYQKRARYGDVGHGYFSSSTRQYVEYMENNWDSAEIKHLRGTYRDSDNREQANSKISLEHLRQMVGLSSNEDLFRQFSAEQ